MKIDISIPRTSGEKLVVQVEPGKAVFIVGPNGSGKSSLVHQLASTSSVSVKRILAHRQNWLSSSASNLSYESRRTQETQIQSSNRQIHSRWKDDYAASKPNISIFDLVDSENIRARKIAAALEGGNISSAKELAKEAAPISQINDLLRTSNFKVSIGIRETGELYAQHASGHSYGIAEMSDGERNAVLIGADVLTAPSGSLLIIDEPERHLHHSIIAPLLKALFRFKNDCPFVISTHSIGLLDRDLSAIRVLVRGCTFSGQKAVSWDIDELAKDDEIDDNLRQAILGARRTILFVEGESSSLDIQLYSIIFPMVSVVPVGSCADVERSVKGVRNSESLHWVKAFGIIDKDGRPPEEIERLIDAGVYAIQVHSVESLYFNFFIQRSVTNSVAQVRGDNPNQLLEDSKLALIQSVAPHIDRLAAQVTTRKARRHVEAARPTVASVISGNAITINLDTRQMLASDKQRLESLIRDLNYDDIVSDYPVRETGAVNAMSRALGFQSRDQYERSVRQHLSDNEGALTFIRKLFGRLYEDLTSQPELITPAS